MAVASRQQQPTDPVVCPREGKFNGLFCASGLRSTEIHSRAKRKADTNRDRLGATESLEMDGRKLFREL